MRRLLVTVVALLALAPPAGAALRQAPPPGVGGLFHGNAMWIWQVPRSSGGTPAAIVAQAQKADVTTIVVKAADAGHPFGTQFSPALLTALHTAGISVCGYQFVYGRDPAAEAQEAIRVARSGADCLVVDAEGQYEGHYAGAQRYLTTLRAAIGTDYPVALAPLPYADFHPRFPYSVFLGPGGAQLDLPQVYWRDIGDSVDAAMAHTWTQQRIYGRPIYPIGQTYMDPPLSQLNRFRRLADAYGAGGVSWWSWQETGPREFATLGAPLTPASTVPRVIDAWPSLRLHSRGDAVIWLQQHLATFDPTTVIDGGFGTKTAAALRAFQSSHLLPVTGETDPATWQQLLLLDPAPVDWLARAHAKSKKTPTAKAARAGRREFPARGR